VSAPVVQTVGVSKHFGGVRAVDRVDCDLYPGEVVGLLGHNGAGKSTLIKMIAGVYPPDEGEIRVRGVPVSFSSPRDARAAGIETIHQTLALAENIDAPSNLFLGRELLTRWNTLDAHRMEHEARRVIQRVNAHFVDMTKPVRDLSGGQRQTVAIARALYFDARILIMDEPCAALGPAETRMVMETIRRLKDEGLAIFLISHDMHQVFEACDRITVMKNGRVVGTRRVGEVTQDEVLGMIILGKPPERGNAASTRGADG
jgi:D-xylose transport system ATP-binding protein